LFVELPCGRQRLALRLPLEATVLRSRPAAALAEPREAVRQALAAPMGCAPLAQLAKGRRNACVVVSDRTRPVPNRDLLPPILEVLAGAGLGPERVSILVATGMHPPTQGAALTEMLGPEIAARYPVRNHDCHRGHALVERIEGHAIEIDQGFLAADLKILTGLIEPHTFAGFSGGGKAVLPGLASLGTMEFMHSYQLVSQPRLASGRLDDNPFQQYIRQVVGRLGVDFLVNAVIDHDRRLNGVFAGHWLTAHQAGCQASGRQALARLERPADLLIASGGGDPLDHTFFQANKGLITARDLSSPGGTVLLVAGCQGGLGGGEFTRLLRESPTPEAFAFSHGHGGLFVKDQWAAQRFYQAKEHFAHMLLFAPGLAQGDHELLGMTRVSDLQGTVDRLCARGGEVVVIPEGPYLAGLPPALA
jgi:nickel-dependent lactate racemase